MRYHHSTESTHNHFKCAISIGLHLIEVLFSTFFNFPKLFLQKHFFFVIVVDVHFHTIK